MHSHHITNLDEINPHLALAASESYVSDDERRWENWLKQVELCLGHDLDGNQQAQGYCMDYAYAAFEVGERVINYVEDVQAAIAELDAAFGPRIAPSAIEQRNEMSGKLVRRVDLDDGLCERIAKFNGYLTPDSVYRALIQGERIHTSFNYFVRG